MKPAWDKLMKAFEGKDGVLVADVDCTAGGKFLCDSKDVQGFPPVLTRRTAMCWATRLAFF